VEGYTLAYSKEATHGLPIVNTRVTGTQPCLNPKQNFKGPDATFWMGELAWHVRGWDGCIPIELSDDEVVSVDTRYEAVGISTTEYDLMIENGVMDMITNRWHWTATMLNLDNKKNFIY